MSCILCSRDTTTLYNNLYDDRYGYPGIFQLNKCSNCGHKFLDSNFKPEQLIRLYTDYYPRATFNINQYKQSIEVKGFCSWLNGERSATYTWVPKNVRVLDIGCGLGESLGYHQSRNCDVYGVEADENIRRVAEKFGYKVHIGLFDPDMYQPDFFDYVTMAQVIEHVTDPIATLKGIAKVLKPGCVAILSTPNPNGWGAKVFGRKWINWHAPYHLQHFSLKSMEIAAEKAGLGLEEHISITSSEWLYYQWIHLATYPKMGKPSVFWSIYEDRGLRGKLILGILSLMHKTKVNHIVTRFFDALGLGDNYIFILRKK